jgi:hypothetical protein
MASYAQPPSSATLHLTPFKVHVEDAALEELKLLLKHAKLPRDTYENNTEDGSFGVSKGWAEDVKEYWETQFDWFVERFRISL